MRPDQQRPAGFSLVEVVLAVGIVAFALIAVFSLFSVSLQTNAAVVDQVEALSAVKALPAFFQSVNTTMPVDYTQQGFPTVYKLVKGAVPVASPPPIYAYSVAAASGASASPGTPAQSVVLLATDPALTQANGSTAAAKRQGRLFGVYVTVSPNFPLPAAATPSPGDLATNPLPSPSPGYGEGALAVQVKVYAVPQLGMAPMMNAQPALTYDLTVPR